MKYSVDTSALIQAWRRYYPIDVFPTLWDRIAQLVMQGDLVATEEVFVELEKKDDELLEWVRTHSQMIVPIDSHVQQAVRNILRAIRG